MPKGYKGFQKGYKNPLAYLGGLASKGKKKKFKDGVNPRKGKTIEEIFDKEKAKNIRNAVILACRTNPKLIALRFGVGENNIMYGKTGELNPFFGKNHSEENKQKWRNQFSLQFTGDGNPNWRNGISFEPYGLEFNEELREEIRKRDNYKCKKCGIDQNELKYKLLVHHVNYNKKNNNKENLESRCRPCHRHPKTKKKEVMPNVAQK